MSRAARLFLRRLLWSTGTLLAVAPGSADAGQGEGRGFYVRFYTGVGVTRPGDLRIRQPSRDTDLTFEHVAWQHKSLSTEFNRDSVPYAGARGGIFLPGVSWLSANVDVVHFKIFADESAPVRVTGTHLGTPVNAVEPMTRYVQTYQVSNGVNLALVTLLAHARLTPRVEVYGGPGAGVTFPYTRSVIDGESRGQYEWGRSAMQVVAGLAWRLTEQLDVSGEYKFTATTVDGSVAFGDSLSRLRTNHLTFGLGIRLGGGP